MPDDEIDLQELAATARQMYRLGIDAARQHGLRRLEAACRYGLEALDSGDAEALVGSLVAVGHHARGPEVYQLMGERMALRRTAPDRRGRQKEGKTKADPAAVRAHYHALIEDGMQPDHAKDKVMSEHKLKSYTTLRKYLRQ